MQKILSSKTTQIAAVITGVIPVFGNSSTSTVVYINSNATT